MRTNRASDLATRFAMPVILGFYVTAFLVSITDLLPRSKAYPQAVGTVLIVLLVAEVGAQVRSWLGRRQDEREDDPQGAPVRWQATFSTIVLSIVFVLAVDMFGFLYPIPVVLAIWIAALGERRAWVIAIFSLGTWAGFVLLFDVLLSVPLPGF